MLEEKPGKTVCFYLKSELDKYINGRAKEEKTSKSKIINDAVLSFKKTGNQTFMNKKMIRSLLPSDRKFTELEAALSINCDHIDDLPATTSGYAKKWGWSRRQVRNLLKTTGFEIVYMGNERQGYIRKFRQDKF